MNRKIVGWANVHDTVFIDSAQYIFGKYIASDGSLTDNVNHITTGFVPIKQGTYKLKFYSNRDGTTSTTLRYAIYDSNNNIISYRTRFFPNPQYANLIYEFTVTFPTDSKSLRFSFRNTFSLLELEKLT